MASLRHTFGDPTILRHAPDAPQLTQDHWAQKLLHLRKLAFEHSLPARELIRFQLQQDELAISWLGAAPSRAQGTVIETETFRSLLLWHLGIPLLGTQFAGSPCPLCLAPMDTWGDHLVCCGRNGLWRRHFAVQAYLLKALQDAGVAAVREKAFPNSQHRPADIFLPSNGPSTPDMAVDILVCHSRPMTLDPLSVSAARGVAKAALKTKTDHYEAECARVGWSFSPLAFSAWGGVNPDSQATLNSIVDSWWACSPQSTGPPRSRNSSKASVPHSCARLADSFTTHAWQRARPWPSPCRRASPPGATRSLTKQARNGHRKQPFRRRSTPPGPSAESAHFPPRSHPQPPKAREEDGPRGTPGYSRGPKRKQRIYKCYPPILKTPHPHPHQ